MATYVPKTDQPEEEQVEEEKPRRKYHTYKRSGFEDYSDYIASPEWALMRQFKIAQAGRKCQLCNGGDRLYIHHRTYERVTAEHPDDLIVLCGSCHDLFHGDGRRYNGDTHSWVRD